jgi:acetolactate synthase-1/2/3 large subunit
MARSQNASKTGRRGFLKGAAAGAAALVAKPPAAVAQQVEAQQAQVQQAQRGVTPQPSAAQAARETNPPPHVDVYTTDRPGSDFMADVIKSLGFEYVAANPGSSFRGLHESLINYGGNKDPELLTCLHEESSVAMAHGYAKIEGRPMLIMAHGTVGLQHASMAIYNAYADRVPVYILLGACPSKASRGIGTDWRN